MIIVHCATVFINKTVNLFNHFFDWFLHICSNCVFKGNFWFAIFHFTTFSSGTTNTSPTIRPTCKWFQPNNDWKLLSIKSCPGLVRTVYGMRAVIMFPREQNYLWLLVRGLLENSCVLLRIHTVFQSQFHQNDP